jgi:hypothetical protein
MKNYQPTLDISETAKNITFFREANMSAFWEIYRPLIPYILALNFLDAVISDIYFSESKNGFGLGGLVAAYFTTVLVISWHRVIIHGPDNYEPMNLFKPQKHELVFIGMGVLIAFGVSLVSFGLIFGAAMTKSVVIIFLAVLAVFALIYGAYRLCFYFPAQAVNASITLNQAFRMTKGYLWKLIASSLWASSKILLLYIALVVVGIVVFLGLIAIVGEGFSYTLGFFLVGIISAVYFQPLLTIIGVTALSNYYLYEMQNKQNSRDIQI